MRLSKDPNKDKRLVVGLENGPIDLQTENAVMYVCPYFPEDQWEKMSYYHFEVDWKNQEFRKIVREMIAPKKRLRLVTPSKNSVNIAIHVREGGGYDSERTKIVFPLKLPPMSFYVEGFSKIISLFPEKEIFCHVFTDALNPEKIVSLLQEAVPRNSSVKFNYRKSNNSHKNNVLEDFFSLFNFDILIRSQSNFSMVPSLIHDYAIVYHPTGASVEGDRVVIDKTNMEINDGLYQKLFLKENSSSNWLSKIWNVFH